MRLPRRLVAIIAMLAVAWTALWPLISSARVIASGEAMPLCHQAGTQVDPSQSREDGGSPHKESRQHCPLCIMAFFAGTSMPVVAPAPPQLAGTAAREAHCAPMPSGVEIQLPQSRAPPALS
jgi:hypothetical protein